jgi:aminoglycoside phosphotransferase (APT) family kinase protein
MTTNDAFARALEGAVCRNLPGIEKIDRLHRLSGGGSQETWLFDAVGANGTTPLILRRAPESVSDGTWVSIPLEIEAELITRATAEGVPSPPIHYVLQPSDGAGSGFVVDFIEGETFVRRILRNEQYAVAREAMIGQMGDALARIQRVDATDIAGLPVLDAAAQVAKNKEIYLSFGEHHPVFDATIKWLEDNMPAEEPLVLVHGDFRNGNFIVGPEGIRAVIDWELAHLGDPAEDFGWACVNVWRFGADKPVGGLGEREELFAAFETAGGSKVDPARAHFWEVFGCLKWGMLARLMVSRYETGTDSGVEMAYIGRRMCESEIDLLNLLT